MMTTPGWLELFYLSAGQVGEQTHLTYGNPMNQVSLSGALTSLGLAELLQAAQIFVVCGTAAAFWIWRNRLTFTQAILILGSAYIIVIGLNPFLHRYFYLPGLILVALAVAYGQVTAGALTTHLALERHRPG
jgi:hypothetical protein